MTKEMIFDLQLFADGQGELFTSEGLDTISITKNDATDEPPIKAEYRSIYDGTASTTVSLNSGASVDAGGGDDSITVGANVAGLTIDGGAGNDYITIAGGAGANTFVHKAGDGKDTIEGYNAESTILIDNPDWNNTDTVMSQDGNALIIKNGDGYVYLKGVSTATDIKVQKKSDPTGPPPVTLKAIQMMQGDEENNTIDNSGTGIHEGTSSSFWTIDGGEGDDTITNAGDKVSISGDEGDDVISIKAKEGATPAVTTGVSIRGGAGDDLIDVSADTVESSKGAHVYEFGANDGADTIVGYNANDSIVLDNGVVPANMAFSVDAEGNFYIYLNKNDKTTNSICIKAETGKLLGGTALKIYKKDGSGTAQPLNQSSFTSPSTDPTDPTDFVKCWVEASGTDGEAGYVAAHFAIPKLVSLTSVTTQGKEFGNDIYEGYKIALGDNGDKFTVTASAVSVNAGDGNDVIVLKDGTNVGTNVIVAANTVTVVGGAGDDQINATADIKDVTRASHVYEFSTTSGNDTILGFNASDTIKISDYTTANAITAKYSTDGKYFILNVGTSKINIQLNEGYFDGGQFLYLVDGEGNAIANTANISLQNTYLTGNLAKNDANTAYILPKNIIGKDDTTSGDNITVKANEFNVYALKGADNINVQGASSVAVYGGEGADKITIQTAEGGGYGKDITIDGGEGSDQIYNEYVTIASSSANTVYATKIGTSYAKANRQYGHVYNFGANDGKDTIYFFSDRDTIVIDETSKYIGSSVKANTNDLVINIAKTGETSVSATITLKDYVKINTADPEYDPYNSRRFTLIEKSADGTSDTIQSVSPPKEILGTKSGDKIANLTNYKNSFYINADAGNDEILNTGDYSTIDAGAGKDTIHTGGNKVSIDAGLGNDIIFIDEQSKGNTVIAGAGTDYIYNNGSANIFVFKPNEGTNYIANFKAQDTIQIAGNVTADQITTAVTSNGYEIYIANGNGNDKSTKIILKGEFEPSESAKTAKENLDALKTAMNTAKNTYETTDPLDTTAKIEAKKDYDDARNAYYTAKVNYEKLYANKVNSYGKILGGTHVNISVDGALITDPDKAIVPKELIGTSADDSLVVPDKGTDYVIDAQEGNDKIQSDEVGVSINAGAGNDTINLDTKTEKNTIIGGAGNDYIKNPNNGGKNWFEFNALEDGSDTIEGFNANDTLAITGGSSISSLIGAAGLRIVVKKDDGSDAGNILIKNIDFDLIGKVNIVQRADNSTANYTDKSVNFEGKKYAFGKASADTSVIGGALSGYIYNALGGNDSITINSDVNDIYINANNGNDTITVESANSTGITIAPGNGDDVINLPKAKSTEPRVFVVKKGQGINTINGICEEDIIFIEGSETGPTATSIASAAFDSEGYFVLTLDDWSTKIRLMGVKGSAYSKLGGINENGTDQGDDGTARSFKLQIGDGEVKDYKIPRIIKLTTTDTTVVDTITTEDVIVLGDTVANQIKINSSYVSVDGGTGNDAITVSDESEYVTVYGGKGADSINLGANDNHVIKYYYGDGNDTIKNWQNGDILVIDGFKNRPTQAYSIDMIGNDGKTFAINLYGGAKIIFDDVKAGDDKTILLAGDILNYIGSLDEADKPATVETALADGSTLKTIELKVPHLIKGSSSIVSALTNDGGEDFTILGAEGNYADTIYSTGNNALIKSGSGNDSITVEGDYLTVYAESFHDTINIDNSSDSSIDAGTGHDVISLGTNVSNTTVNAGVGNDIIFGNGQGNVYRYKSGDGNDTIYGFSANDTLIVDGNIVNTNASGNASVKATANGLVIYLDDPDKSTLTLKGRKKSTAAENSKDPDDFEFLTSQDNFKIYIGDSTVVPVAIEDKQVLKANNKIFQNYTQNIQIEGAANANDSVYNHEDAVNVVISSGNYADHIFNEADKVSINGGVGADVIYLNKAYSFDSEGKQVFEALPTVGGLADFDSLATRNTIIAGAGDDTIWGNRQGDEDSSNAHVYQYNKGHGKDVIYDFGDNDVIEIKYAGLDDVKFIYSNTKKFVDNKWVDDPNHKDVKMSIGDNGSITLIGLRVGQTIHYKLNDNPQQSEVVEKIHTIAKVESTVEADTFTNETDEYVIKAAGGIKYVSNTATKTLIDLSAAVENHIDNTGNDSTLVGSSAEDTITNSGANVSIVGGSGKDLIFNEEDGSNVTIQTGYLADTITNKGTDVTINSGDGDDVINNEGTNVLISSGNGADKVINTGDGATINTGDGNDTINVSSSNTGVVVVAGKADSKGGNLIIGSSTDGSRTYVYNSETGYGNDTIIGWNDSDILQLNLGVGEKYKHTDTDKGFIVEIYTEDPEGKQTIINTITIVMPDAGATIDESGNITRETTLLKGDTEVQINATFKAADSTTTTKNETYKIPFLKFNTDTDANEEGYTILGTANADKRFNKGKKTTINAYAGNDTIYTSGDEAVVNAGEGNDLIIFADAEANYDTSQRIIKDAGSAVLGQINKVTVEGGAGNDTVIANDSLDSRTGTMIYNYTIGDGADVIKGFTSQDLIQITGVNSSTTVTYSTGFDSLDNFIINITDGTNTGSIKLEGDVAGKFVNIATRKTADYEFVQDENVIIVPYVLKVDATHTEFTKDIAIIQGTGSADTIISKANTVSIKAGGGADSIILDDDNSEVKVFAGGGNDTITAYANHDYGVLYVFGSNDGNNLINNYGANDTIKFEGTAWQPDAEGAISLLKVSTETNPDNKDIILTYGSTKVTLKSYDENVNITYTGADNNEKTHVFESAKIISGSAKADTIITDKNSDKGKSIYAYAGSDTITNVAEGVKIFAGADADLITNTASEVSIYGGADADRIVHTGTKGYIDGGAGNDLVTVKAGSGQSTIVISGNDTITVESDTSITEGNGFLYEISGTELITAYINGFTDFDTIKVTGGDTISVSQFTADQSFTNGYYKFKIGKTTLLVKGAEGEGVTNAGAQQGDQINIIKVKTGGQTETANINVPNLIKGTADADVILSSGATKPAEIELPEVSYTSAKAFVNALAGADYINNTLNEVTISAGDGIDTVTNSGNKVSISGGADKDIIENTSTGTEVTINGDAGTDSIKNAAANVMIYAGADNDTIENSSTGTVVTINGDAGTDSIKNDAANVMIYAGEGNDTIENSGTNVTIDAGAGKDLIKNTNATAKVMYIFDTVSSTNTIEGWNNNSTIYLKNMTSAPTVKNLYLNADGSEMTLKGGNNVIILKSDTANTFGKNSAVKILYGANQTPVNDESGLKPGYRQLANGTSDNHAKAILDATSADMSVKATSYSYSDITVKSGAKQLLLDLNNSDYNKIDIVKEEGNSPTSKDEAIKISSPGGMDTITNAVNFVSISSGDYRDNITNSGQYVTIRSGSGGDIIENNEGGSNVIIDGGNGNDTITNKATKVLIDGGESVGADVIINEATATEVSIYGSGGKDSITNEATKVSIYGGDDADSITNSGSDSVLIDGGAGNDTITNSGNNVTINAGKNADLISITGGNNIEYYFEKGFGSDTIIGYDYNGGVIHLVGYSDSSKLVTSFNSNYSQIIISVANDTANKVILNGEFADAEGKLKNNIKFKYQINEGEIYEATPSTVSLSSEADGTAEELWTNTNDNVTVNTGSGNDFIKNTAKGVLINGNYSGNKYIVNSAAATTLEEAVTINTGEGNDTVSIESGSKYALVNVGSTGTNGSNYVTSAGENITVEGGDKVDRFVVESAAKQSIFKGNAGNDKFTVAAAVTSAENANTVYGGAGADEFSVTGNFNIINGDEDADKFTVEGKSNFISGGAGNDKFTVAAAVTSATDANTIFGGAGNDEFTITKNGNIFKYSGTSVAEGSDTIIGYDVKDTIQIAEADSIKESDGKFTFGNTSILLKDIGTDALVTFKIGDEDKTWKVGEGWQTPSQSDEGDSGSSGNSGDSGSGDSGGSSNDRVADYNYFMEEIFEDSSDTFTTDIGNDLSDIDYLNKDTYSTGNIEDAKAENLVQNSNIITAGYGKNENQQ